MGSFSKLAKGKTDVSMQGILEVAGDAIRDLHTIVQTRPGSTDGMAAQVCAFWTTGAYLDKAKIAKEEVERALKALMMRSVRNPPISTLEPQLFPLTPLPSPLTSHP